MVTEPQEEFADELKNRVFTEQVDIAEDEALVATGETDTRQKCSTAACSDEVKSPFGEHCNSALTRDPSASSVKHSCFIIM